MVVLKQDSAGGRDLLGRITPSFRQLYEAEVAKLQSGNGYLNSLLDIGHRDALGLLMEEAWGPEHAAMANADLPTVMDALNLTANVHNRKLVKTLERRISELQKKLDQMLKEQQAKTPGGGSLV